MRIESPRYTERFGSVRINDVQQVLELDSGKAKELLPQENIAVQKIEENVIKDFEEKMAIVIPTKDEKLKLFEGVVSGVPHECLIIVVSNSQRRRVDRFRMEKDTLNQFCHFTRREALIHQKDPVLAQAMAEAGYTSILGEDGLIRSGKAEGMVAAMLIAKAANKDYVGFIDADNYFPGAVWEYARCYAAGFSMAKSPYAMVRVLWRYKPKVSGRVSEITNRCMNSLISNRTGFDTEVIKTGNAGEHAMSMRLAEILTYASGYAVEPQELMSIFEGFGGILPMAHATAAKRGVEIFQTETRNPHLHEEKGGQHLLVEMLLPGLGSIYHSPICEEETKQAIIDELLQQNAIQPEEEPPKPRLITPLKTINLNKFTKIMEEHMKSYSVLEEED
jgi:mannosyl-3-phosphoglycerate synthase